MSDEKSVGWIAAQYTDGPNADGYYSAGIDIPMVRYGKPDMHGHAIEFHSKDKATAEARRDAVLAAVASSAIASNSAKYWQDMYTDLLKRTDIALRPASHEAQKLEALGRQSELETAYRGKAFRPL